MSVESFTSRPALPGDLPYMMKLQRDNRESVGGLPSPALQERIDKGTAWLGLLNGDPACYLLLDRSGGGVLKIPQACVQYDARRRQYGMALLTAAFTVYQPFSEVRLRCAADLEANLFWRTMGFVCVGQDQGGVRRGRIINVWHLYLGNHLIPGDQYAVAPAAQFRVDTMYDDSGFLRAAPTGFQAMGALPKLAWANRRQTVEATAADWEQEGLFA